MKSQSPSYKYQLEGKDYHGVDCECGDCNLNGHSYGVGIYWAEAEEPCEVIYRSSEEAAIQAAEQILKKKKEKI